MSVEAKNRSSAAANVRSTKVIGIMSGTSLDGLDIAYCHFSENLSQNKWTFEIKQATTVEYPKDLAKRLRNAQHSRALELIRLHKEYGEFIARKILEFLDKKNLTRPDLIASHGHTIFHYPEAGINFQIGDGAVISAITGITTVSDFRSQDIALGGQGAPLVPMGDKILFAEYSLLLNLGGFSNITVQEPFIAFDICPVNFALNYFARKFGMNYDRDGQLGRQGQIYQPLLQALNQLDYYTLQPPKSLSDHWFEQYFLDQVERYKIPVLDKLRTVYEHIAAKISEVLNHYGGKVLVTGGGAKNKFLMELISQKINKNVQIHIPGEQLIDYKEALVFAFLGLLRYRGEHNIDRQITGAQRSISSGAVYLGRG